MGSEDEEFTTLFQDFYPSLCRFLECLLGGRAALAQQLLYRNIMLRREADSDGDVQVATLLGSLEPILLDIANLRDKPRSSEVQMIKERVERTSLVPLLQVNSLAVARANE